VEDISNGPDPEIGIGLRKLNEALKRRPEPFKIFLLNGEE
jgi:hypothetical protein